MSNTLPSEATSNTSQSEATGIIVLGQLPLPLL